MLNIGVGLICGFGYPPWNGICGLNCPEKPCCPIGNPCCGKWPKNVGFGPPQPQSFLLYNCPSVCGLFIGAGNPGLTNGLLPIAGLTSCGAPAIGIPGPNPTGP